MCYVKLNVKSQAYHVANHWWALSQLPMACQSLMGCQPLTGSQAILEGLRIKTACQLILDEGLPITDEQPITNDLLITDWLPFTPGEPIIGEPCEGDPLAGGGGGGEGGKLASQSLHLHVSNSNLLCTYILVHWFLPHLHAITFVPLSSPYTRIYLMKYKKQYRVLPLMYAGFNHSFNIGPRTQR